MNPRDLRGDPVPEPPAPSDAPDPVRKDPDALIDRIREQVGPEPGEREAPERGISSILVPILPVAPEPLVLFTRRSEHLSAHPGEISYPGGRKETRDANPLETAVRETEEEVGLRRADVDVLGHFTDFRTYHGILICGYIGLIDPAATLQAPTTPSEVAERLLVPLSALLDGKGQPGPKVDEEIVLGDRSLGQVYPVQAYEGRQIPDGDREGAVLHYWRLAPDTTVWGITGELTARFLATTLGWTPPVAPDPVEGRHELPP